MIKKILVATDGSDPAGRALDFALDLAGKYFAKVTIISVSQTVSALGTSTQHRPYVKELKAHHQSVLSEALKKAKKVAPDLNVETMLVEGRRPADEINKVAKDEGFDLIAIGSRGMGGAKEFFLGSVSDRVADEAPCPVVIVK